MTARIPVRYWIVFGLCGLVLLWIVGLSIQQRISISRLAAAPVPVPAQVLGYGTIVGYDLTTETRHISEITLHSVAAGDPCNPCRSLGFAHEGQRVAVLERRANGAIKVRTPSGIEGWTDSEFVKVE